MLRVFPLLAALLVLSEAITLAQPPGQPPGPPPGPPGPMPLHLLLHQKSVQDDLKLTQKQVAKIRDLIARDMQQHKQLMAGQRPEQFKEKMHELFKETDKNLQAVLQEGQQKRLKEITLQIQAPRIFTDPKVSEELKLSEDQQEEMRQIMDKATADQKQLFQGKPQPAVMQKKMADLKKSATEKTLGVLTSEQRGKWTEMTGKAFKGQISMPPPPPMGFPPPPPPGVQGRPPQ